MRGIIVLVVALFGISAYMLVAPATMQPVADSVTSSGGDMSEVNGGSTIQTMQEVMFQWVPLTFIAGFGIFAVAWYFRRELATGRRP